MTDEDLFEDLTPADLDAWAPLASSLSAHDYAAHVARATTRSHVVLAYEAALRSARPDVIESARTTAARRFPAAAKGARLVQIEGRTAGHREREILEAAAQIDLDVETKRAWRSYLIEDGGHPAETIESLAVKVFDEAAAGLALDKPEELRDLERLANHRRALFAALVRITPAGFVARIRDRTLREEMNSEALERLHRILRAAPGLGADHLIAEAGAAIATVPGDELLTGLAVAGASAELVARTRGIAEAHEALSRASERGEPLMTQGIHRHLLDLAKRQPDDWAEYLRLALWRRGADSFVVQPTLSASQRTGRVADVLREILEKASPLLRDRARALLALVDGTGERPSRTALLRLVELVDGPGAFPHPLQVRSSTWLGSLELEALLRGRIELVAARLARELPERMARNEEKITTRIVTMIKEGLRDASEVAAEATESGQRVEVECSSRELSRPEEYDDGADIAWILEVDVPGVIKFEHAEFTQAKKAVRKGRRFVGKWDIDVAQLDTLRGRSETAVYWLYGPDGTIYVVPARLLGAMLPATEGVKRSKKTKGKGQKTARFDLGHVRSMAIPVSQFLIDLFIGAWLGTTDTRALRIARGKDKDRPDVVFQVSIRAKPAD